MNRIMQRFSQRALFSNATRVPPTKKANFSSGARRESGRDSGRDSGRESGSGRENGSRESGRDSGRDSGGRRENGGSRESGSGRENDGSRESGGTNSNQSFFNSNQSFFNWDNPVLFQLKRFYASGVVVDKTKLFWNKWAYDKIFLGKLVGFGAVTGGLTGTLTLDDRFSYNYSYFTHVYYTLNGALVGMVLSLFAPFTIPLFGIAGLGYLVRRRKLKKSHMDYIY